MALRQIAKKRLLLLAAPLIAGSTIAASPAQAATFASSRAEALLGNFTLEPVLTGADAASSNQAFSQEGIALATSNALAAFDANPFDDVPTTAGNTSVAQTQGFGGRSYFGDAKAAAQVVGNFIFATNQTFGFDFAALLDLQSSIDDGRYETAKTKGSVEFALFDGAGNLVDFFSTIGATNSHTKEDFLISDHTSGFQVSTLETTTFGGWNESANAQIQGRYSRHFEAGTVLTLIELKQNEAHVKAPEPVAAAALFLVAGLAGASHLRKRRSNVSLPS